MTVSAYYRTWGAIFFRSGLDKMAGYLIDYKLMKQSLANVVVFGWWWPAEIRRASGLLL